MPAKLTPIAEILGFIQAVESRRAKNGDMLAKLHNGRFRRIRSAKNLAAAYKKTEKYPAIKHPRVLDATPLEWEEA